jgi:hypothetical protein
MAVFSPYTVVNDRIFIKHGRYDRLLYPSTCPYPHPSSYTLYRIILIHSLILQKHVDNIYKANKRKDEIAEEKT